MILNHCHHQSHRVCNFLTRPDQYPDDLHEYVSYILTFFSSHMHHLRREKKKKMDDEYWFNYILYFFSTLIVLITGIFIHGFMNQLPNRIEFKLMKTKSSYEMLLLDTVQLEHQCNDSNFLALTSTSTMRPVELRWAHDSGSLSRITIGSFFTHDTIMNQKNNHALSQRIDPIDCLSLSMF